MHFFEGKPKGGIGLPDKIIAGHDDGRTLPEVLDITRSIQAPFAPGLGKAHYSVTNFELLGAILKLRTGLDFATLVRRDISGPLGCRQQPHLATPKGPTIPMSPPFVPEKSCFAFPKHYALWAAWCGGVDSGR